MPNFQVWMEGYAATGERGVATYEGEYIADSFPLACHMAAKAKKWGDLYDPQRLSYWGCRLFDNEADARKSFG